MNLNPINFRIWMSKFGFQVKMSGNVSHWKWKCPSIECKCNEMWWAQEKVNDGWPAVEECRDWIGRCRPAVRVFVRKWVTWNSCILTATAQNKKTEADHSTSLRLGLFEQPRAPLKNVGPRLLRPVNIRSELVKSRVSSS